MSKGIIDGIIHRLIIQNLLKRHFKHVVANPVHPTELIMLLSVVCCLLSVVSRGKKCPQPCSLRTRSLSPIQKRLQNPRDFSRTVCLLCPYWGVPGTQLS